jgi:hypothetical protein
MNSCIEASNSYFHDTLKKRTAMMSSAPTLQAAAQTFVDGLYADFGTAVLVRLYTYPFTRHWQAARARTGGAD